MDLIAYIQMEDLENIVKENGIEIHRPRGYRLMKDEKPHTQKEIQNDIDELVKSRVKNIICEVFIPWFGWCVSSDIPYRYRKCVLITDDYDIIVNWNELWKTVHGKKRKKIKYAIKQVKRQIVDHAEMWNRNCGKNVLYCHAKQGSTNWSNTTHEYYQNQPWYLESIDDSWDHCYADIYCKL